MDEKKTRRSSAEPLPVPRELLPSAEVLREHAKDKIRVAFATTKGDAYAAAKELGMSKAHLYKWLPVLFGESWRTAIENDAEEKARAMSIST